jgi:hypothetical protein
MVRIKDSRDQSSYVKYRSLYVKISHDNSRQQLLSLSIGGDGNQLTKNEDEEAMNTSFLREDTSRICRLVVSENATKISDFVYLANNERNHQIMQNFAKAQWNVLKQYKQQLEVLQYLFQGTSGI